MQQEAMQLKTTKLSLYLLKSEHHEDDWFKEHNEKIADDCCKKAKQDSFIDVFRHPVYDSDHLYVSFMTQENPSGPGLRYPIRVICYLDQKELSRRASKELKSFLKEKAVKDCPVSVLNEILHCVAETFPGVPVAELEPS